jgi:hypothetical protein
MDNPVSESSVPKTGVRTRSYAIRFPFTAEAELLEIESGDRADGVTADISLGGCFVYTNRPLPLNTRTKITLTRKDQVVEAIGVVRTVKPNVGMGIEFIGIEEPSSDMLYRWIYQLRHSH